MHLRQGKGNLVHPVGAGVILLDRDALFKAIDDDVFLQRTFSLVDEGYDGRVKFVFDAKHI